CNPNSAIDRIKNSLSYKLGFVILEHKKQYNGAGYITLLCKLYKTKQQHFKKQKLYKQIIKIFPQLTYPEIKSCKDYSESIKYKYHLSYMLGQALIKAHKTCYKGGYFKLYKNIKTVKRKYALLKELNLDHMNISLKNKELIFDNLDMVIDILENHKNYKPILENIFYNFDYVLKHLDLIKEWLLSDDFYQKYKKENHPYPSLFDPEKLNNENEIDFIYVGFGLSGNSALAQMFQKLKWRFLRINLISKNDANRYKKYISDYGKYKKIVILVRDPISRLQTGLNHGEYFSKNQKPYDKYCLDIDNIENMINRVKYIQYRNQSVIQCEILRWLNAASFAYSSIIDKCKHDNIVYIDMREILPNKAFMSLIRLSNILGLNKPKEEDKSYYEEIKNGKFRFILPIIINFKEIDFYVTLRNQTKKIIVNQFFNLQSVLNKEVVFSIDENNMNLFKTYCESDYIFNKLGNFFNVFLNKLHKRILLIDNIKIKESDILNCCLYNKQIRTKLRYIIDKEIIYLKQHHPDIVASWRYYQEFEKMCKELDGDI
ncbi:DUF2972 domain-containing protein, partial [Campylobacter jejuni]